MKRQEKDNSKLKKRLLIVNAVLLVCLVVSVVKLTDVLGNYANSRRLYKQASEQAVYTPEPAPTASEQIAESDASDTPSLPQETPPIQVDFDLIHENGKHVRGWLYCADTVIDYPVVAYSNNEYFLTHDYTGAHNTAGALFFDSRNTTELTGDQLIIYGHHMKDKSMFGSLLEYQKQEYYDLHPTLYLITENKSYRVDVFAGWFVDSNADNFPVWFSSEQAKKQYVETAMGNSDFVPSSTQYYPDARILSLVTCAYSSYVDDARYQLLGWLVELK